MSTQEKSQSQNCSDNEQTTRCAGCSIQDLPNFFAASNIEIEPVTQRVICSAVFEDGSEQTLEMPVHSLVALAFQHSAQFVDMRKCTTDK